MTVRRDAIETQPGRHSSAPRPIRTQTSFLRKPPPEASAKSVVAAPVCRYGVETPSALRWPRSDHQMRPQDDAAATTPSSASSSPPTSCWSPCTLLAAILAAGLDLSEHGQRWQFLILALAIVLSLCVNLWMLQRRFAPLERLIDRSSASTPPSRATLDVGVPEPIEEIDRLAGPSRACSTASRTSAGAPASSCCARRRRSAGASRATCTTRSTRRSPRSCCGSRRSPRTRPPERVEEVAELKRLVNQAMDELLNLARQLRPTALDDHGLVAGDRGAGAALRGAHRHRGAAHTEGDPAALDEDQQIAVYRVAQEALANVGRHAGATAVESSWTSATGRRRAARPRRRRRLRPRWSRAPARRAAPASA